MAGDSIQPLTPAEAKERLRQVAGRLSLQAWTRNSPWSLLVLALGGGYLAGRVPAVRTTLIWSLAQLATTLVRPSGRISGQTQKQLRKR